MSEAVGVSQIRELLVPHLDQVLALATALTEVESGSLIPAGVDQVSALIAAPLEELGFVSTWSPVAPGRGQAFESTLTLSDEGVRVLVLGHADTVWPAGSTTGWAIDTADQVMTGPGLGDMKCALAMAVHAIGAALEAGVSGVASITYALVPDEELGSVDSRQWLEDLGRRTDVCLALEAGLADGGVIVSRGAVGAIIITAHGLTSHSTDETGASAVAAVAPLVAELEALTDRPGRTLCTVGILRGGTARQVVPDHAELHLDLRAPSTAAGEALVDAVRRRVEAQAGRVAPAGVRIEISGGITRPALPRTSTAAVYALAQSLAADLDLELREIDEMGGSDASLVGQFAPLCLDGLGPTAFDQCSRAETVLRDSVLPRTALLAGLIAQAGGLAAQVAQIESAAEGQ